MDSDNDDNSKTSASSLREQLEVESAASMDDAEDGDLMAYVREFMQNFSLLQVVPVNLTTPAKAQDSLKRLEQMQHKLEDMQRRSKALRHMLVTSPLEKHLPKTKGEEN